MKKSFITLLTILSSLVLTGCFQSETTIHLNKDGSGKLIEETRLGGQMLAMFDQMAALGGDEKAKEDPTKAMFSEDKAKARAAEIGEGVTFEKQELLTANGSKGNRVTYTFKDINKLKISAGDSMKTLGEMPGAEAAAAEKAEPVKFTYVDNQLTIQIPSPKTPEVPASGGALAADADAAKPDMESPEAMAMMKQMCGDMKMSLKIVVESGIAETDATHQDGNTLTLMEMNMGKLVENAEAMKKLSKMNQKDPAATMKALEGIDGIKMETKEKVTVKLQ